MVEQMNEFDFFLLGKVRVEVTHFLEISKVTYSQKKGGGGINNLWLYNI